MCSILGFVRRVDVASDPWLFPTILSKSQQRGRDGFGWIGLQESQGSSVHCVKHKNVNLSDGVNFPNVERFRALVGNYRAEPTTEFVKDKIPADQQPYQISPWIVVHNGTISNDKDLRTGEVPTTIDSAAIVELIKNLDCELFDGPDSAFSTFADSIKHLEGSFAILAINEKYPDRIMFACNYRPLWYVESADGIYFASSKDYFPDSHIAIPIEPYTYGQFILERNKVVKQVYPLLDVSTTGKKALVVASGGMDSTVAAASCIRDGMDVSLLHFQYGCRAQGPEQEAIEKIAKRLKVDLLTYPIDIYKKTDSNLFGEADSIVGGEKGAEFAHEWVPARNLVMLSIATAIAEANGFDYIVLGNNMEEAGAYPDNEPEFIRRFNEVLPFAVGSGKRVRVLMPVGDMMKHEIVKLGHVIGAPLDLSWSCYRKGEKHCGKCGPCYMRRKAFEINNLKEVIEYEN